MYQHGAVVASSFLHCGRHDPLVAVGGGHDPHVGVTSATLYGRGPRGGPWGLEGWGQVWRRWMASGRINAMTIALSRLSYRRRHIAVAGTGACNIER